jgi:bromodomain-containing factor 1
MDLGTIRTKLDQGAYPVPPYAAFEADMRLIFKNCYVFNPPGTAVHTWGKQTEQVFEDKWNVRPTGEDGDDDRKFRFLR